MCTELFSEPRHGTGSREFSVDVAICLTRARRHLGVDFGTCFSVTLGNPNTCVLGSVPRHGTWTPFRQYAYCKVRSRAVGWSGGSKDGARTLIPMAGYCPSAARLLDLHYGPHGGSSADTHFSHGSKVVLLSLWVTTPWVSDSLHIRYLHYSS